MINFADDPRLQLMQHWLETVLETTRFSLEPASKDASFRRYFRVQTDNDQFIVMDAPPAQEPLDTFIQVTELLEQHHVDVPQIFAQDCDKGFLLLTDFGNTAYLSVLNAESADRLYLSAMKSLIAIQKIPLAAAPLPPYDRVRLHEELALFEKWFLQRHLGLSAPACLTDLYTLLIENAIQQPQVVVHRDYHSRNIMYQADRSPGIIDFQDAVIGPVSYDLVSLLKDAYISWPDAQIQHWVEQYCQLAQHHQLLTAEQAAQFPEWFDLMGLQRHLKILGIFCRLNYRDDKPDYLKDLPLTLRYVFDVCERYPQLAAFHDYLQSQPLIRNSL